MIKKLRWPALGLLAALLLGVVVWWPAHDIPELPPAPVAAGVVHTVVGTSVEGRPIDAYTYGQGPARILFVGGIHGGYEWNSTLLAYKAMEHLAAQPGAIPPSVSVMIVPSANPDGLYKVVGTTSPFAAADVVASAAQLAAGRFNANQVDLNRNFDCKWQPTGMWRGAEVSAGSAPFSEPEARAVRDLVETWKPGLVVFWHSQANAVYASECHAGILAGTRAAMSAYAGAAGYPAVDTFDAYPVTGDAEGWLASIGVPAITVELSTHESIDWEKNLAGIKALLSRPW